MTTINLTPKRKKIFVDIETRSELDLRKTGAEVYAQHASTKILCISYARGSLGAIHRILPDSGTVLTAADLLRARKALFIGATEVGYVAHNIGFERAIFKYVAGFETNLSQWEDTAAIARFQSLPGALKDLAAYFGYAKDMGGNAIMLKLSKPRKLGAKMKGSLAPEDYPDHDMQHEGSTAWWTIVTKEEDFQSLYEYCDHDVRVMQASYRDMVPMPAYERRIWYTTQRINERGLPVNMRLLKLAQNRLDAESDRISKKAKRATDGISPNQVAKLKDWLGLDNLRKATVEAALESETDPRKSYVLRARLTLGMASTKKVSAMILRCSREERIFGSLVYAGASRTARWSGYGIQPQNFPRGYKGEKMSEVFSSLSNDEPLDSTHIDISNSLKGFIAPPKGYKLLVGDYSQIECRVLAWLAGQTDVLDIFARGEDVYCDMASTVYRETVTKKDAGKRQLGKAIILGCGYGMGGPKFKSSAYDIYGVEVDEKRAKELVNIYRQKNNKIVKFWRDCEETFRRCIGETTARIPVGSSPLEMSGNGTDVYVWLPSGRPLIYSGAHVKTGLARDIYETGTVCYFGKDKFATGQPYNFNVQTYSGKLCENFTQAVARDCMAEALVRLEENGMNPILTVHDEAVAVSTADRYGEFERLLEERPTWALDLPVETEGGVYDRYQK